MAAPIKNNAYMVGLVIDFETGGLKCQESAITEIAMHAIRLDNFKLLGTYVLYAAPYNRRDVKGVASKRKTLKSKYDKPEEIPMEYSSGAMSVTGITMEQLERDGRPLEDIAKGAIDFIKEHTCPKTPKSKMPIFIAHNALFDEGFWCQLFEYTGLIKEVAKVMRGKVDFYGNWHPETLDTLVLFQLLTAADPDVPNHKLGTMAEYLGVALDDAHEADADVLATANSLMMMVKRMRRKSGASDDEAEDELQVNKAKKSRPHFKI